MKTKLMTLVMLLASPVAFASGSGSGGQGDNNGSGSCPNYQNHQRPCMNSQYPLVVAGNVTIRGDGVGDPPGRHRQTWCKCGQEPWVVYGIPRGYWHPTRKVDVVTKDTCAPSKGQQVKQQLEQYAQRSNAPKIGGGVGDNTYKNEHAYYHFHSWENTDSFQGLWTWVKGGNLETSLTNPYWAVGDEVMSNWLYPELSALSQSANSGFFDLAAKTATCIAQSMSIGQTATDFMYWLGGCNENALPTVGFTSASDSTVRVHDTILQRHLSQSNRTGGFASVTNVGDMALCGALPAPFVKRSEFKVAMLAPYSEAGTNTSMEGGLNQTASGSSSAGISGQVSSFINMASRCDHNLGASEYRWGVGKNDQAFKENDENATYLVWRWVDACVFGAS